MVGFLTLPIRLLGIVLMAVFCMRAMKPLRSLEVKLVTLTADPESNVIATTAPSSPDYSSLLLTTGLALVAVIAIWLLHQTWRQQIALADAKRGAGL